MNRLSLGILLTFGLILYVKGLSDIQSDPSLTGYIYEKPVNTLEIPVIDEADTVSTKLPEEETVTEEQDHDNDLKPEYLRPGKESNGEREETLEREDGGLRNRKREFKTDKMKKNSDGESDIPLKRKNNLHRSYSQESGDNLKRKPATGSKQKKIRQT